MIRKLLIDQVPLVCWTNENGFIEGRRSMIFVHGAGGDHTVWEAQYGPLQAEFNIASLNLPGHGPSGGRGEREIGRYVEWVWNMIVAFGLRPPPVLIGHSLGAAISLAFAIRYGDELSGVVSVGAGVQMPVHPTFLQQIKTDMDAVVALFVKFAIASSNRDRVGPIVAAGIRNANTDAFYGDMCACNSLDLSEGLSRIRCPALVLCGEKDKMTPPALSQAIADRIEGARLECIPGAGHFVMIEDAPAFNKALSDFVRGLP